MSYAVTCLLSSQTPFRSVMRTPVECSVMKNLYRTKSTGESDDVTSAQVFRSSSVKTAQSPNSRNPVAMVMAAGIRSFILIDY